MTGSADLFCPIYEPVLRTDYPVLAGTMIKAQFGHEQLDVYRVSIRYVAWAHETAKPWKGIDHHARDQLIRIVSMLTKPGQRNYEVRENTRHYAHLDNNDDDDDKRNDNGTKDSR